MGKHVILLGAGASYTSGYPLAADLRLLLSSKKEFEAYLFEKFRRPGDVTVSSGVFEHLKKWFSEQTISFRLFREGGFGTVDEFSYLAGKDYPQEVHNIKQLVGVILALHNPELPFRKPRSSEDTSGFESSDYYPFIQRLFRESDEIREDIVVLTYNYDPYLDFLLARAYQTRKNASGKGGIFHPTELTSGFRDRDTKAITNGKGFCLLKLHGTAVLPPQPEGANTGQFMTHNEVFIKRDAWLSGNNPGRIFGGNSIPSPGMFFPWELLDESGDFVSQNAFKPFENQACGIEYFEKHGLTLYELCRAIWLRAQKEIAQADRVSFVGLSMHRFLENGLRFLFSERTKKIEDEVDSSLEIVLACRGACYPGSSFKTPAVPNSLADRLAKTLCKVYPKMQIGSASGRLRTPDRGKNGAGGIVCYEDFASFIQSEL